MHVNSTSIIFLFTTEILPKLDLWFVYNLFVPWSFHSNPWFVSLRVWSPLPYFDRYLSRTSIFLIFLYTIFYFCEHCLSISYIANNFNEYVLITFFCYETKHSSLLLMLLLNIMSFFYIKKRPHIKVQNTYSSWYILLIRNEALNSTTASLVRRILKKTASNQKTLVRPTLEYGAYVGILKTPHIGIEKLRKITVKFERRAR